MWEKQKKSGLVDWLTKQTMKVEKKRDRRTQSECRKPCAISKMCLVPGRAQKHLLPFQQTSRQRMVSPCLPTLPTLPQAQPSSEEFGSEKAHVEEKKKEENSSLHAFGSSGCHSTRVEQDCGTGSKSGPQFSLTSWRRGKPGVETKKSGADLRAWALENSYENDSTQLKRNLHAKLVWCLERARRK
ncbi:uncharacterized protein LOC135305421 isoform X1 [Passer domesticus]|uniref:uncharacterized protein LOC135305421 isoform X1 n=1 Tax=Passer domesticus TaxID=48849 RepID=UPI0030FF18E5